MKRLHITLPDHLEFFFGRRSPGIVDVLETHYRLFREAIKKNEKLFTKKEWDLLLEAFHGHVRNPKVEDTLYSLITYLHEAEKKNPQLSEKHLGKGTPMKFMDFIDIKLATLTQIQVEAVYYCVNHYWNVSEDRLPRFRKNTLFKYSKEGEWWKLEEIDKFLKEKYLKEKMQDEK